MHFLSLTRLQKRMLLQICLGFLLGRVALFDRNPVGAAFFAGAMIQGGSGFAVAAAVAAGMFGVLPLEATLRYIVGMLGVWIGADLLEHARIRVKLRHSALLMALVVLSVSLTQFFLLPNQKKDLLMTIFDCVLILAFSRILYEGQHFLLFCRKGQAPDHEQLFSLIVLGMLAVYGLPSILIADISLLEVGVYFLILLLGYRYGAGAGAVAGAVGGILLFSMGQDSEVIGTACLLGICVGMLYQQGKIWVLSFFLLTASAIGMILNGEILPFGTLKAMLVDGFFFLLIPEKYIGKISFRSIGEEEKNARENFQNMMKYKLQDFSKTFGKLAHVMAQEGTTCQGLTSRDMGQLLQNMRSEICEHCDNRENCMGEVVLGRPENIRILAMAQEQGVLELEQMPAEFTSECVHSQRFLMETNQKLRMQRLVLGFQNKLAQNRQAVAGQMEQVGELIRELAENMAQIAPLPAELEHTIEKELGMMRVLVRNLVFYQNRDNRMEIHMLAATSQGRLVMSREVSKALSEIMDRPFIASMETRNVIPYEECQMIFVEDTPMHVVSGAVRVAKDGEEVSGDNFSCMHLNNGEVLLALSDGMGSGQEAMEESQKVIELLEQMMEAGFSRTAAIHLINSLYITEEDKLQYATADVVVMNLYEGECFFVKNGAAATWIRHPRGVEMIEGQALPVGILQEEEPFMSKGRISPGDYVIMVTDGVVDAFEGICDLSEVILDCKKVDPQDMAQRIMDQALACTNGVAGDDMCVVVAGVWK